MDLNTQISPEADQRLRRVNVQKRELQRLAASIITDLAAAEASSTILNNTESVECAAEALETTIASITVRAEDRFKDIRHMLGWLSPEQL